MKKEEKGRGVYFHLKNLKFGSCRLILRIIYLN